MHVISLSGCLLVEELTQQDGQSDTHKEKHDPAACGDDADPRWYSLDSVVLANVGPVENEQQHAGEYEQEAADEPAKGQVGQEAKRLLQLGHGPVQLGDAHFGRCCPASRCRDKRPLEHRR